MHILITCVIGIIVHNHNHCGLLSFQTNNFPLPGLAFKAYILQDLLSTAMLKDSHQINYGSHNTVN